MMWVSRIVEIFNNVIVIDEAGGVNDRDAAGSG
jgi:hypothetical protein